MDDEKLRGRFKVINAERNFIIEKTDVDDFGNYTCELNGVVKEIHVICKYRKIQSKINLYKSIVLIDNDIYFSSRGRTSAFKYCCCRGWENGDHLHSLRL